MILFRPRAKRTACECVAWWQTAREGPRGTDSVSKQYRSPQYFVGWEECSSGKTGRRRVCRLAYKGWLVGGAPTFENLPKRKRACLKMRSTCQAIQCVVLRYNTYMIVTLRSQTALISLRPNCRWIG